MSRTVDRGGLDPAFTRDISDRPVHRLPSRYSTMHLLFDIFQGIGIAAAVGIRPFLPALVVGALAAGDIQISFAHSSYSFLQGAPFLLVMVIGVALLALTERRVARETLETPQVAA